MGRSGTDDEYSTKEQYQELFIRECLGCGNEFEAHDYRQKYCKQSCRKRAWKIRHGKYERSD